MKDDEYSFREDFFIERDTPFHDGRFSRRHNQRGKSFRRQRMGEVLSSERQPGSIRAVHNFHFRPAAQ